MRLWTSQTIEFYNELMRNGIAYCTRVSEFAQENDFAYHWIAEETRKRIGEPPMPEIKLPVWAWYQFDSKKKRKPPLSNAVKNNPDEKEICLPCTWLPNRRLWSARRCTHACRRVPGHKQLFDSRPSVGTERWDEVVRKSLAAI